MAQYIFGTGQLYGMPVGGGDPLQFGALQDVSVDISADIKELYGQYGFALAVARGKTKVEGKAMTGEVNPDIYNSLYFGNNSETTGATIPVFNEAVTIPAVGAGPTTTALTQVAGVATATFAAPHGFTVDEEITVAGATPSGFNVSNVPVLSVPTPTTLTYAVPSGTTTPASVQGTFTGSNKAAVANAATFVLDLHVMNASTGVRFKQVASGPLAGQYTVSAGVYTFNSADAGTAVLINYLYTNSAAGNTIAINNVLMGVAPTWQMVLTEVFNAKTYVLVLYSCTSSKLSFPFKQDDFGISELDFSAQANAANQIGYLSVSL